MSSEAGPPVAAPARPRRGYWVPGLIALAFLVTLSVVFVLVGVVSHVGRTLPGPVVANDLALDLESGGHTPAVHCPAEEPRRAGVVFECTADTPGGPRRTIRVTETSERGGFRYRLLPAG